MLKHRFFILLILLFPKLSILGQNNYKPNILYTEHSNRALNYYNDKEYLLSAISYDSLFKKNDGNGLRSDKYNAACSWALAGNKVRSFDYLKIVIVNENWSNVDHLLSDTDLSSLHDDKRWQPLIEFAKNNKEKAEANYIRPVIAILDTIYEEDQADRRKVAFFQKEFGENSKKMDSLWQRIIYLDSINLIRVKKIIDEYGWPGEDQVGPKGGLTVFLVIQHADSLTQVSYLPKLREAVRRGQAQPQNLALLEDRVLVTQGKEQIYGSQLRQNQTSGKYEFYPIEDEPNVNIRRASVGLNSLEEYAKLFDIIYRLPQVKN